MAEIKIIPIFNQAAPGVWHDFAHICAAAMRTNYNSLLDDETLQEQINMDAAKWKERCLKFAFGAYDGARLVGFIQGTSECKYASIDSLYIMKQYQREGIGRRLVRAAENAVSNNAQCMEVISLSKSESFYEVNGYVRYGEGRNVFFKQLNGPVRLDVVPVFHANKTLTTRCKKIDTSFNSQIINVHHRPMFAYYDVDARLVGYVTGDDCHDAGVMPTPHIYPNGDKTYILNRLQNRMARYMAHSALLSR